MAQAQKVAAPHGEQGTDAASEESWAKIVIAIVVLLVGAALGIVDTQSPAHVGLRIPALIASLMLVADSINVLLPIGSRGRSAEPASPATAPGSAPEQVSAAIPVILLVLAIWLGISTLNYDADMQLKSLSLTASFLIFSRGLADLPGR